MSTHPFETPWRDLHHHASRTDRRLDRREAGLLLGLTFLILLIDALVQPRAFFDLGVARAIQSVDAPGLGTVLDVAERLTGSTGALSMGILTFAVLALLRSWAAAITTGLIAIVGLLNLYAGPQVLVDRVRPHDPALVRTSSNFDPHSFPSGHVLGAVLLYGLLFAVAGRIWARPVRLGLRGAYAVLLAAIGFQRVWSGAHWPSDVIGAYALGGLLLVGLIPIYRRLDTVVTGLPLVHAGPLPHDHSLPHAHALTSLVFFQGDRVAKVYDPGLLPRVLYWLAFQAPFPYERNRAALEAATHRRNLAAALTTYWYGSARVARILAIEPFRGRLAVVSERVAGGPPADPADAKRFLAGLRDRFEEAGLPTWQIDPRQPRAVDNVLRTPDGTYMIVDLESGLVSPLASRSTWRRALRRALVPIFDDVYADVTRAYVAREEAAMTAAMGGAWVKELRGTIDAGEAAAAAWRAGEPRVWHRLLAGIGDGFGIRRWPARVRSRVAGGREAVTGWAEASIAAWEAEGRLRGAEGDLLRRQMQAPAFQAMVPYLGAHLLISVPLRFPVGSLVRPVLVAAALGAATVRLLRRRIDRQQWKLAWSIHSPLVMLLSATPGVGSFAYLASKPIRADRLLLRVLLDAVLMRVPKRLYERSGGRRLVARAPGTPDTARVVDALRPGG
jgi:undecaprenyl-diphosphatase